MVLSGPEGIRFLRREEQNRAGVRPSNAGTSHSVGNSDAGKFRPRWRADGRDGDCLGAIAVGKEGLHIVIAGNGGMPVDETSETLFHAIDHAGNAAGRAAISDSEQTGGGDWRKWESEDRFRARIR